MKFPADVVAHALHRLFIGAEHTALRREDHQKVQELVPLLDEVARAAKKKRGVLVDLCAGKSPLGLVAAALALPPGWRVVVVDRDDDRVAAAREAIGRLDPARDVHAEVVVGDVGESAVAELVAGADVVCALHACGQATDVIIDVVTMAQPTWVLLVPCCYGAHPRVGTDHAIPGQRAAAGLEGVLPRQGLVGRKVAAGLIDAERTLRLEAAGYDTEVVEFCAPTVTPHNLLWRGRRGLDDVRRADAVTRRRRLLAALAMATSSE
jgi:hypothetical protein